MADQLTTASTIYKPTYNPETNTYYDVCPFAPNSRNNQMYKCPCKGREFNKRAQFNSHILSQCHINYVENYSDNIKEVEDLKTANNVLLADNVLLKRKNELIKKKMELMEEKMKRCENECRMLRNMKEVFNYLMDNDEEFQDCNEE